MKILEYNGIKNFINNNTDIAMAWASYYTNNDLCLINGDLYRIKYCLNKYIVFKDGTYLHGNYYEFKNLETQEITFVNYDFFKKLRNNNKIKEHFIVFNERQLQINNKDAIDDLMKYRFDKVYN